jgi:membrane protein DedA with SNARE-associated domain
MHFSIFSAITGWAASQGYLLLFIGMLIEGPVITAGAAFGAAVGYFNPWLIVLLSVLGNLIPDIAFYALGFWGREQGVEKYGHRFGITKARIKKMEQLYAEHPWKTLLVVKLLPAAAIVGLTVAGVVRMPFKKFAWLCAVITIPTSFGYFLIGYYAGTAYTKIIHYIDYGGYVLLGIGILVLGVIWGSKKLTAFFAGKIEKI